MNYSFEYLDIILLAMIAGFIFLRLRGILGKRSGYEEDISNSFPHEMPEMKVAERPNYRNFDEISFRSIARNIGVVSSAPYNHFKDKKHLIKEVILLGEKKLFNIVPNKHPEKVTNNINLTDLLFVDI